MIYQDTAIVSSHGIKNIIGTIQYCTKHFILKIYSNALMFERNEINKRTAIIGSIQIFKSIGKKKIYDEFAPFAQLPYNSL